MILAAVASIRAWVEGLNRLQVALIAIIAISGGLIAVYGNASPAGILASSLVGVLLGVGLTVYLTRIAPESGAYGPRH